VTSISAQCGCVTFPVAQDPPESRTFNSTY